MGDILEDLAKQLAELKAFKEQEGPIFGPA